MAAKTEPMGRARTNVATTKSETREIFFKDNFTTRTSCKLRGGLADFRRFSEIWYEFDQLSVRIGRPTGSSQAYSFSSVSWDSSVEHPQLSHDSLPPPLGLMLDPTEISPLNN